jgi:YfiH family protein
VEAAWTEFVFPDIPGVRCAFGMRPPEADETLATPGGTPGAPADRALGQGPNGVRGNISYDVGDDAARVADARRAMHRGLGFASWLELAQVHGTRMAFGHGPADGGRGLDAPGSIRADGHATSRAEGAGRALVIKTADCQPVLLAHAGGDFVAALHVGWRGNALKFIASGVAEFCARYGLAAEDLSAVRGPSLGPEWAEFVNFEREWDPEFAPWFDAARRTMNLWRLTRDQLLAAGLRAENIHSIDRCTRTDAAFFSYRRGDRGRQASLVWLE